MVDEALLINAVINGGVVAVLFYVFIVKVSDKLDRLIEETQRTREEIAKMTGKIDALVRVADGKNSHGK